MPVVHIRSSHLDGGGGLVQEVVHSGEGAGAGTDSGHELHTLSGLAKCEHKWRLLGQVLRLCVHEPITGLCQ